MRDYYEVLGLPETATDEEIAARYKELKEKYGEDRWLDGEAGNDAAKKLTKLEMAYREITATRKEQKTNTDGQNAFEEIAELLKADKIAEAQTKLDDFNERNAEWHYLQAVVFYKKSWTNDSKKQLEIAMQMDPDNQKYKNSYSKLNERIKTESNKTFTSYTSGDNRNHQQYDEGPAQMGGDGCCQWCCEMAICNMCLNCFCNSCG